MNTLTVTPVFNRKKRLNKQGKAVVQIRFTFKRKSVFSSTGIYVKPSQWDREKLKVKNHTDKFVYNTFLNRTEEKALKYFYDCLNEEKTFSLELLMNYLEGKNQDFIAFFRKALDDYTNAKPSTLKLYENGFKLLEEYKNPIPFSSINYKFINDFESHLKKLDNKLTPDKKLSDSYVYQVMRVLSIFIKEAVKNDLLRSNPFSKKKMKRPKGEKVYLTIEEIAKIEKAEKLPIPNMQIRDVFLFQCYTGLRFSDAERVTVGDIKDGWLQMTTKKTGSFVKVPLEKLWSGKGYKLAIKNGKGKLPNQLLFDLPDISNVLKWLKIMAKYLNIDKNITTHVGRNSFSEILRNDYQVPIDIIKEMMGHTTIKMTEGYAKMDKRGIENVIDNIAS